MKYEIGILVFSLLVSSSAIAGKLPGVPHTFSSGTAASASKVNENFEAVRAAVDGNASDIAVNTESIKINTKSISDNISELDARIAVLEKNVLSGQAGRMAYLRLDDPTPQGVYTPSPLYSYNSSSGTNTVTQDNQNRYVIKFYGVEPFGESGGNVQVTTYENPNDYICAVDRWFTVGVDVEVTVSCADSAGNIRNSKFTVLYIR